MSIARAVNDTTSAFGVGEIANRERCKRNTVVYNLPEKSDQATDKAKFIEMCKEISNAKLKIIKLF